MTNRKTTRRALVLSLLSLLICCSMLVGTTFAWFTDSVTSGKNKIVAGNLDIELEYSKNFTDWTTVNGASKLFSDTLWEPGHTQVVYLRLSNLGTLALKYNFTINFTDTVIGKTADGEDIVLSEHLKYDIVDVTAQYADRDTARKAVEATAEALTTYAVSGKMVAGETAKTMALVVFMPESVGNEANYRGTAPQIDMGIELFATQLEAEMDSFGNDYDAAAPYDLPSGFSAEDFGTNVAVDGDGNLYATLTEAVKSGAKVLYMAPGADLGNITHLDVADDLTIYGNDAYISGGEHDFAVDTYVMLTKDITLNIYGLNGVAVWAQRNTAYTANINLYDCQDMNRIYMNGTSGANNITLEGCSFNGTSPCAIYSNANGAITIVDTTFANVGQPINLNHKVAGTQTVTVKGCDFVNCGNMAVDSNAWSAAIRTLSSVDGAKTVLNISDVSFTGAKGFKLNGDILLNDTITSATVSGTVEATVDAPGAEIKAYPGTTLNGEAVTSAPEQAVIAKNDAELKTAIENGESTIALPAGTYVIPTAAQGKTLTIVGSEDTVIATNTSGSYEGCNYALDGSTVTFENVTITTDNKTYTGYARCNATFNNCVINNSYTLYGNSEFNNCVFNISGDQYNIWTWGAPKATFNGCTFNSDGKAMLLYGSANTKLTLNNCVFNDNGGLTDLKAAVEIGNDYGASYELIVNNTVVNGYEINDKGINTGSTLWGNKNSMGTDKLNVVIDGVDVY